MSIWRRVLGWFHPAAPVVPILTTRHCLYIARTIEAALDVPVQIMFAPPEGGFGPGRHIVICPQIFDVLPDDFTAFQMEQTVSPRWFEPPLFAKLLKARAIVDYSRRNLAFLAGRGIAPGRLHHLPVGYIDGLSREVSARHEVVFYGDANNVRRRGILDRLAQDFRVTELAKIFGDDLYGELLAARVVVNIHYYDGALLETTRLMECLSLGCLVVSEEAVDMDEYEHLRGLVDFVPAGDVEAMAVRVRYWLDHPEARAARLVDARAHLAGGQRVFAAAVRSLLSQ